MGLTTPVKVNFGKDGDACLDKFVFANLTALINSYRTLHTTKIKEWRRLTKGTPKEAQREFPWPGASNVIIQVIGENVATIKAVQLGTIYEILPLWVSGLIGSWEESDKGEEQRRVIESFMDLMGMSKEELDLYRVESRAAHDIASLGSCLIKAPWVTDMQYIVTGIDAEGKLTESEETLYDGPRPEKLAFEDWAATPTAQTWEQAKFKYHELRLYKHECEYRVHKGHFDKKEWDRISNSPDIEGLTEEETQKIADGNLEGVVQDKELARWRFYECWLEYTHNNKKYNIIYVMHLHPQLRMMAYFNFYPRNEEPFEFARLGYDEDNLLGYGFAEMGEMYQEDASAKHNQRNDHHTICNTSVVLAGNNPRVDSGITLFPMAVLPFDKNEVSIEQLGQPDQTSVSEEELTLALAKARFGTEMLSAEGSGSGAVDKKGNYNNMGTFSVMQQGARRINVNITDFRYMHLNLGNKFLRQYAYFGVGDKRTQQFGKDAEFLIRAMSSIKEGKINFPIKAATASINREVEKQTGMLFTNVMQRHYSAIAQVLQGVTNPTIPPDLREYLVGTITGMSYIMSRLLRAFGYDDIVRMQPELKVVDKLKGANNGQSTVPSNAGTTPSSDGRPNIQETPGQQANGSSVSGAPQQQGGNGVLLR